MAATATAINTILSHKPTTSSPLSSDKPPYTFSFTPFLRSHGQAALTTTVPVCPTYSSTGSCPLGRRCPNRHPTPVQQSSHHYSRQNDNYVCKHWLKGLCKKGEACDYLHEYNLRKMSECQFYNQNGYCQNGDECLYVHVKEDSKLPLCEDYNKGFCEKGPRCGKRHVRRRLCEFYMAGFCPEGPDCKDVHLKNLPGGGIGGGGVGGGSGAREEIKKRDGGEMDSDRRDGEDGKKDFGGGWKGARGRGGGGPGRWKDRRRGRG